MTISPESFSMLCFLVLMENGDGVLDKSPDYITEKMWMLRSEEAFGALDIHNMRKVKKWCDTWGVTMPEKEASYLEASEKAAQELKERGFDIGL